MPPLINGRYSIGCRVDEGGFGIISKGKDVQTGREVVLKFEKTRGESTLQTETKIYNALSRRHLTGFAEKLYSGRSQGKDVIVLEKLGRSLFQLLQNMRTGFSINTVAMIGIQMLYRLEALHGTGYLHRDLKPDNILVEQTDGKDKSNLYLIDFGNGQKYLKDDGTHVKQVQSVSDVGTIDYSPFAWHLSLTFGRKHDLISLLYLMIFLHKRKLPWSNLGDGSSEEIIVDSGKMKRDIHPRLLCKDMPVEIELFYRHVCNLGFEEAPDYRFLRSLMRDLLAELGEKNEFNFEWLHWNCNATRSRWPHLWRKG